MYSRALPVPCPGAHNVTVRQRPPLLRQGVRLLLSATLESLKKLLTSHRHIYIYMKCVVMAYVFEGNLQHRYFLAMLWPPVKMID